jgi:hypothetical protein
MPTGRQANPLAAAASLLAIAALLAVSLLPFGSRALYAQDTTLPEGYHDGSTGEVIAEECLANGWAVDPDDPDRDLTVQILADGVVVATTTADQSRPDVGACPNGTCGFRLSLWGLIAAGEAHLITTQAYDVETGAWVSLTDTPRSLTCWGYPEGYHDGLEGVVDQGGCVAYGWAVDPDNRDRDVLVRVLADGSPVTSAYASDYGEDMDTLGLCPNGTCRFTISLWDLISPNAKYQITAQAYDEETGTWRNLLNTPRPLACLAPPPPGGPVQVPAEAGWVDSGFAVTAGTPVAISASGRATTAPPSDIGAQSGPDGQSTPCSNFDGQSPCALDGAPYGALIGRIGPDGPAFLVGSRLQLLPDRDGVLYLAVNDNLPHYADNRGGFKVSISR